jgi:hypothetical protein
MTVQDNCENVNEPQTATEVENTENVQSESDIQLSFHQEDTPNESVEPTGDIQSESDNTSDVEPVDGVPEPDELPEYPKENMNVLKKLFRTVVMETLFVWLITFDYAVIFPAKVHISRIKNESVEFVRDWWTRFAERAAKFQLMLAQCPEFSLVFIVFLLECIVLALNIRRTVYWLHKTYKSVADA